MKVNINRAAFAEALGLITTVVPARTPKPILRCILIIAEEKSVSIKATDLEAGIFYTIPQVQVEKAGEVVIPADKLASVVRESTDETLTLEADEGACEITGSDSHYHIFGQQAGSFPTVLAFDGQADMEVSLKTLQSGVAQCLFATAKESTRYALNGVLWEIKGKKLSLIATDGRRLAKSRISLVETPSKKIEAAKIIVPAKALGLLERVSGSEKDAVKIKLVDNQILLSCGNVVISSNLVEGTFPKYEDIIPTDYDKKLHLSTEATLSAVRRAALLTSEESRGVRLAVSKGKIVFSSRAPETGDAQVQLPIDYKGEPIEIGFNPQFIIDALRVMPEAEFDMEFGQPDRPATMKCGKDFLYVLMPINLS